MAIDKREVNVRVCPAWTSLRKGSDAAEKPFPADAVVCLSDGGVVNEGFDVDDGEEIM
jgi:hypothetical protein